MISKTLLYTAFIHTTISLTWFTVEYTIKLSKIRGWTIHSKIDLNFDIIMERNLPEL
jgi:hypothetical protein